MTEKEVQIPDIRSPDKWFGIRHIQYVLFFFAALIAYCIRTSLNIGIIAMISSDPPIADIVTYPEWAPQKNVMLSSFFWGYLSTQIIAGQLAERFGPKWFLAGTFCVGSLFSIMVPTFGIWFGYKGVIACRVLQGMSQGFIFPCLHNMLGKWCPLLDRAKACGFAYAGAPLGTVIAMPITGLISNAKSLGWSVSFYLFGSLGVAWTIVWAIVGSDCPSKNRFISNSEMNYITSGLKSEETEQKNKVRTPWIAILTSLPFWAIVINDCGESWGYWTLLTEIPSFMHNIMNFDIESNSLLSAIPYLFFWLLSIVFGFIADNLILRKLVTVTDSRKLFNSIAMFIPAISLIALTFVDSAERVVTIILLVIAVGCTGGIFCGYTVNHIDLSPNYAGTLMGMANTVSNVFSLLAPLFVDAAMDMTGYEETDKQLWTIVFCTSAGIYILVGIVFILAGSGEIQKWNSPNYVSRHKDIRRKCFI